MTFTQQEIEEQKQLLLIMGFPCDDESALKDLRIARAYTEACCSGEIGEWTMTAGQEW